MAAARNHSRASRPCQGRRGGGKRRSICRPSGVIAVTVAGGWFAVIAKKGVASIEELRDMAIECDVKMIACQMTMDLFEFDKKDMIDGITLGGAATYMENALKSDINLYI